MAEKITEGRRMSRNILSGKHISEIIVLLPFYCVFNEKATLHYAGLTQLVFFVWEVAGKRQGCDCVPCFFSFLFFFFLIVAYFNCYFVKLHLLLLYYGAGCDTVYVLEVIYEDNYFERCITSYRKNTG